MSDRILKALGATDELEALRIVADANAFMGDVKSATGAETFAAALETIKSSVGLSREISKITEKSVSAESLGTVLAWKSSHEQVPGLNEKVANLEEEGRKRDVADLIAQGQREGKLTPATAKHFEARSAEELRTFLAVAPRVIPSEHKQPKTEIAVGTNANGAAAAADGRAYEDMKPAERSSLKKSDPDLFNAIRSDWERRGKPAGVVALAK